MNASHVRLDEAVEYIRGITFKPEDVIAMGSDGAVACMRTKNIQGMLDESDLIAVPSGFVKREELYLRPGDVLISSANSWNLVGKVVPVPELNYHATAGGFIAIVRARAEVVDARYLFHWLNADATQAKIRNCGRQTTNISNLSSKQFLDLVLPRPSLAEQQRIAAILDKVDSLRRKRQEAISLADDLLRSTLLTCLEQPFNALVVEQLLSVKKSSVRTGPFGSQLLHAEFTESGVPVLGIDNVVTNRFQWGERRYISAEKYEQLSRYTVYPGDVMVTIMGTTGRVAVAPDDLPVCISTKHLCTMTVDREKILPEFLWACLLWDPAVRAQSSRESKGAIMDGLNMGIVKGLQIKVPSIDVQHRFVSVLRKVDALRRKYKIAVDDGATLTAALSSNLLAESSQH